MFTPTAPTKSFAALLLGVTIVCSMVEKALAWGPEGHAIVAYIAESNLSPKAKAEVDRLLALEQHDDLAQIASWADKVRATTRPETAPWHFVDIPLSADSYDAARDCANGDCVVQKIEDFAAVLGNRQASDTDRLEALKFLVHFVGDIHQPLHCEDNKDRGGNNVHLSYFHKSTNLHSVWDGKIIDVHWNLSVGPPPDFAIDFGAVEAVALNMEQLISQQDRDEWAPPDMPKHLDVATVQWASDSHTLARDVAYADLPPSPRPTDWSDAYEKQAWPVVQSQLERAGVRLAAILNSSLN